jgi:maleate cis-trans isomerase
VLGGILIAAVKYKYESKCPKCGTFYSMKEFVSAWEKWKEVLPVINSNLGTMWPNLRKVLLIGLETARSFGQAIKVANEPPEMDMEKCSAS